MQGTQELPHFLVDFIKSLYVALPVFILWLIDRRKRVAEIRRLQAEAQEKEQSAGKTQQERLEGSLDKLWIAHSRIDTLRNERDEWKQKYEHEHDRYVILEEQLDSYRHGGNGKAH